MDAKKMLKMIKKNDFWAYLDEEVSEAKESGAGLIIQFDGNLWAGNKLVPNDPRNQNKNGKLFEKSPVNNCQFPRIV